MKEEYYFNENWLRCLGDYCTECDGSRKLGKTISDEIIELNGMFDEYNEDEKPTKRVGFKIGRFILLGMNLDEVLKAVKDYHAKLVAGNVDEVIPLGPYMDSSLLQLVLVRLFRLLHRCLPISVEPLRRHSGGRS